MASSCALGQKNLSVGSLLPIQNKHSVVSSRLGRFSEVLLYPWRPTPSQNPSANEGSITTLRSRVGVCISSPLTQQVSASFGKGRTKVHRAGGVVNVSATEKRTRARTRHSESPIKPVAFVDPGSAHANHLSEPDPEELPSGKADPLLSPSIQALKKKLISGEDAAQKKVEPPVWQRMADAEQASGSDSDTGQQARGRSGKSGRSSEKDGDPHTMVDGAVVVEEQQSQRLSAAERRAARRAGRAGGVDMPIANRSPQSSKILPGEQRLETAGSQTAATARNSPNEDRGEWRNVPTAHRNGGVAQAAASESATLPLSESPRDVSAQIPGGREAPTGNQPQFSAEFLGRFERAGEASTSGSSHESSIPTVGTLSHDIHPPTGHPPNQPPQREHRPGGARTRRRDPPPDKDHSKKPQFHDPVVTEVAAVLRNLGREFETSTAVEDSVSYKVLAQMNLAYWNEVVKILGRGGWCRQLEAVLAYLEKTERFVPNEATYARIFFGLHRNHRLEAALGVFNSMRESSFPPTTSMYNAAMSILIKLGRELPLVEALFVEMPTRGIERDRITFSVMMDAVFRAGTRTIRGKKDRLREATPKDRRDAADQVEALYEQMLEDGLAPDTIVKNTVLNALVGSGAFRRAEEMFGEMLRSEETPPNDRTYTMMMHMYSERKDHQKVQEVFKEMTAAGIPPTDITYNVLIKACQGTKNVREAIRLFREMASKKLAITAITYNSLVEVLASSGYFSQAEEIIYGMEVKGFEPSPEPYNMLITGLVRARGCYCDEAMRIFKAMQLAKVKPWALTFGALMEGFGKVGRLEEMEHVYRLMRYAKLQPTTTIFTAMIHAYIRVDDLETSWELFAKMREVGLVPNVQTYTVLINGLAARGELDVVDEVFAEAKEELLELDAVIYEAVLTAHVAANSLLAADSICKEMEESGVRMLPHTYDKLAALHTVAGRHGKAQELAERKLAAYPDWEEQRRAISAGRLRNGYDTDGEEEERPPRLVLEDIWAILEGTENLDESVPSKDTLTLS